jgi:hypothetical protein
VCFIVRKTTLKPTVLVVKTSVWVDGCPIGPSGLLALAVATWDLVDVCGWLFWGMWVVRIVASAVVKPWPLAAWDGPSVGSSFVGFFGWQFMGVSSNAGIY